MAYTYLEHRAPTPGAKPYICVLGEDGCIWFCASGTSRIGRLDTRTGAIREFPIPTPNAEPIGILTGPDGAIWFSEKSGNKIGRLAADGGIREFALPTPNSAPAGVILGPDNAIWFSLSATSGIGRITADGAIAEFYEGFERTAGRCRSRCATTACGSRRPTPTGSAALTMQGRLTEYPIPTANSQPRAMFIHPDGSLWFVETDADAMGRIDRDGKITEHKVAARNASLRSVTISPDGELWITQDGANSIARMAADGGMIAEYPLSTPNVGLRCLVHAPGGRVFFSEYNTGCIGELRVPDAGF